MGNGSGLTFNGSHFIVTLNGQQVAYAPANTFSFSVPSLHGDFSYPFYIMDASVPDSFIQSFWASLRVLHKLKIGKKEDIQLIINRTGEIAPKMWRTHMQNMLFNKKEKERERKYRQEKPKTYNPLDKYRSSMKGKFK